MSSAVRMRAASAVSGSAAVWGWPAMVRHFLQGPESFHDAYDRDPGLGLQVAGYGEVGEHDGEVGFDRVSGVVEHGPRP